MPLARAPLLFRSGLLEGAHRVMDDLGALKLPSAAAAMWLRMGRPVASNTVSVWPSATMRQRPSALVNASGAACADAASSAPTSAARQPRTASGLEDQLDGRLEVGIADLLRRIRRHRHRAEHA